MFGSDVNWRDVVGRSALFYAIQNENIDIIITLIANYSSCFALDTHSHSLTPL